MSITVNCSCGRTFQVKDEYAGVTGRCPSCQRLVTAPGGPSDSDGIPLHGATVSPPAGPRFDPAVAASRRAVSQDQQSSVSVSPTARRLLVSTLSLALLLIAVTRGPVRAMQQWKAMEPRVAEQTCDVVRMALEREIASSPLADARRAPLLTQVTLDPPFVLYQLPAKVSLHGRSTEGQFKGTYFPPECRFELTIGVFEDTRTITVHAHVEDSEVILD